MISGAVGAGESVKNKLSMSKDGIETLKQHESVINGLYDDPSGYATFGVGHLAQKFKSVLLETARTEGLCESRVKTKWPGKSYETAYLEREAVGCSDFAKLKERAAERAPDLVARAKYGKPLKDLPDRRKILVHAEAQAAVQEELRLLNQSVDVVLTQDLKRFEKAVNSSVTGVALTQGEFDALVSIAFNIGTANFGSSTLLKKINQNKYRTGNAAQRKAAIDEIEKAFLAWKKSGGKVLPGLEARRAAEAAAFLKTAKKELTALEKTRPSHPSAAKPPKPSVVHPPR